MPPANPPCHRTRRTRGTATGHPRLRAVLAAIAALGAAGGAAADSVPCTPTNVWESGDFIRCAQPHLQTPALEIVGPGSKTFSGFGIYTVTGYPNAYDLTGPTNWRGGPIALNNGFGPATVLFQRGDWYAHGNDTITLFSGSELRNSAVFGKAAGSGETTVQMAGGHFLNTDNAALATGVPSGGVIDAQVGTIAFRGTVFGNRVIFEDDSKFTGAGRVLAALNLNTFGGRQFSDNLELAANTHRGVDAVLAGGVAGAGVLRVSGGTFDGQWRTAAGTEVLAIAGASGINLSGTGFAGVVGPALITNQGQWRWQRGDLAGLGGSGSVFANEGSFVFEASGGGMGWSGAAGVARFENTGVVQAAAGVAAHVSSGGFLFDNRGTLHADAGATLRLSGANTMGGPYSLQLREGTRSTGAGVVRIEGTVDLIGRVESDNAVLDGGQYRGGGIEPGATGTLAGTWRWTGGLITGRVEVAPDGVLRADGAGGGSLRNMDFTNRGRIEWASAASLGLGGGGTLRNEGTIDFATDAGVLWNGFAGAATFVNDGLIVKSAGSGTTPLNLSSVYAFSNPGTIHAMSGAIALPNNFVNTGTLMGSGSFVAPGLVNQGVIAPGNSPGLLTLQGSVVLGAGSTLAIELQDLASFDQLAVTGNLVLGGTLALSCWAACALDVGDSLTVATSGGVLSGSFAAVTLSGFGSGGFDLVVDSGLGQLRLVVTEAVTPVPEPGPAALLLAGLTVLGWVARRRQRP